MKLHPSRGRSLLLALAACRAPTASAPAPPIASIAAAPPTVPDAVASAERSDALPEPVASPPPPPVDAGPPGCAEAHALTAVRPDDGALLGEVELENDRRYDDLSEHAGSPDAGSVHVTDGACTYTLEGNYTNDIVAREGPRVLWRVPGYPVAGGIFGVALSQGGRVLTRSYSRGKNEVFDARTGARYAEVGRDLVIAPTDAYALDPPAMQWFANAGTFDRAEVRKLSFSHAPATVRTVVRLPIDPHKDYSAVSPDETPQFGAAICATGALYVVSYPRGEVALYRASDDAKLASAPRPPSGRPVFTRSGRFVLIRGAAGSESEGKNVAAYRLEP